VEVTISGKIRGSRSACAKFIDGYIKKCGEPATRFVREGFATVQLKPGVLGIYVRIMPPDTVLPDKVDIIQPPVEETPVETVVEEGTSAPVEEEKAEEPGEESISDVLEEETAEEIEDIEEIEEEAASEKPAEEEAAEKESKEEPAEEKPAKPEEEAAEKKPAEEPAKEPAKKEPKKEKPKAEKPEEEKPKREEALKGTCSRRTQKDL